MWLLPGGVRLVISVGALLEPAQVSQPKLPGCTPL